MIFSGNTLCWNDISNLSWSKAKKQKNSSFFCFLVRCLEEMYEESMKKPKTPWLFLFFCLSSTKASFKKTKKTRFFLVFKNLNQKKQKKTRKTKKNIFWPETKTYPKSFGFLVFWFSRGFVKILFCWKRRVLLKEEEFLRLYTTFWTYKIDAKKNKHLNIVKSNKIAQIPVNSEKIWVLGGGGGVPNIYIYTYI